MDVVIDTRFEYPDDKLLFPNEKHVVVGVVDNTCYSGKGIRILETSNEINDRNNNDIDNTNTNNNNNNNCQDSPPPLPKSFLKSLYSTISTLPTKLTTTALHPFTTWDSAHFLTLAYEGRSSVKPTTKKKTSKEEQRIIEQRHVFFPLYPYVLRTTTYFLFQPLFGPPDSYMFVFTGVVLNLVFFLLSTASLIKLTTLYINESSFIIKDRKNTIEIVVLLYLINPANVFLTTNYSEGLFAAFTFTGFWIIEHNNQTYDTTLNHPGHIQFYKTLGSIFLSFVCFLLASFTKSTGIVTSVYVVFNTIGWIARRIDSKPVVKNYLNSQTVNFDAPFVSGGVGKEKSVLWVCFRVGIPLIVGGLQFLACVIPSIIHELNGRKLFCGNDSESLIYYVSNPREDDIRDWCDSKTNIYSYIQEKYWDVGLFKYYTMNNIPNFLLATPMVVLCMVGGTSWIYISWCRYFDVIWIKEKQVLLKKLREEEKNSNPSSSLTSDDHSKKVLSLLPSNNQKLSAPNFLKWALWATTNQTSPPTYLTIHEQTQRQLLTTHHEDELQNDELYPLLKVTGFYHPRMIKDYALLVILTLICIFLANVQIVTRVICSSCPCFYWLIASRLLAHKKEDGEEYFFSSRLLDDNSNTVSSVCIFFVLYNLLGVAFHGNWLPWT